MSGVLTIREELMLDFFKNLCPSCFSEEKPAEVSSKPSRDLINYVLNDPTTPELMIEIPVPVAPNVMEFIVRNFEPTGAKMVLANTADDQGANVYATMVHSINNILKYRDDLKKWAAVQILTIEPRAGNDLNAYYDRRNLKFFYSTDRVAKKVVYTCDSVDIVAHELGHALLDAMRPDMWNTQSMEIHAFHEGFGDINAIATIMLHNEILEYALKETDGDMRKSNVVSKVAEEMGNAIYNLTRGNGGFIPGALRDAVNSFHYEAPERLPYTPSNDKLGGECHSFGRLIVGAWYDVVVGMYEHRLKQKDDALTALCTARDTAYHYIVEALKIAPNTVKFYNSIARGMLSVDRLNGGEYFNVISKAFNKRKILRPIITHLAKRADWSDVQRSLKEEDVVCETEHGSVARVQRTNTIKLSEKFGIQSLLFNPLYDVEVEVPGDVYYDATSNGKLIQHIQSSDTEVILAAKACLDFLHHGNLVGDDDKQMFNVVNGKLERKMFVCSCGRH